MKDSVDTKTVDMLPGAPRRRGRPSSGNAMTAAERQAKRAQAVRDAGDGYLKIQLSGELLEALDKFVEFKDETRSQVVERLLRDRLLRKR